MKSGDWVIITPDDYDQKHRRILGPFISKIVDTSEKFCSGERVIRVKQLFHDEVFDMFEYQCEVIQEAP